MKKNLLVKDEHVNSRLDRWFKRVVSDVPQSFIEKNIRKGKIKVNNKRSKCSYKLKKNDFVVLYNITFSINDSKKKAKSIYQQKRKYLYLQVFSLKTMIILR